MASRARATGASRVNFVLYAIPFFILAMAVEFAWGRYRGRDTYRLADTISSLQLGTLSRLTGVLSIGIGGAVYDTLTSSFTLLALDPRSVWVWIVAFVAYDVCYYWSHRFGHEWRLFWASHVAHHQSEEFNLSTALRQTSTGFLGFVFYVPLYVIGFPVPVIVSVGSLNLIYQFWVHTEHVRRLGPLEWVLVTPSNHRVHHAKNPEYLDRNYGGVFILWDRLFGTFRDEDPRIPCVYGTTRPLASWNPLWANAHVWYEGISDMIRTRHFADRFRIWVEGPGWRPRDLRGTPQPDWRLPKFDPPASAFARAYTFVQFWVSVAASFAVLLGDLPQTFTLLAAALLAFWFYVQGAWLEGRPHARRLEWLRFVLTAALAGYGALDASAPWGKAFAHAVMGYVAVSALAVALGAVWAARRGRGSLDAAPGLEPAREPAGG